MTLRSAGALTGLALGSATVLGCSEAPTAFGSHEVKEAAVSATNGLPGVNGLSSANGLAGFNGLPGVNGLSSANGLAGFNGLQSTSGLMTTNSGRRTIAYLVKCALAAGDSLVKQDQTGVNYTFAGGIGLCPEWKNGAVNNNGRCLEAISACLMAHVNTAGIHVPLWLDNGSQTPAGTPIGWGVDRTNYPMQEGTFFGDIIDTGNLSTIGKPNVTGPVAYYCDGAGYPAGAAGVVAGRLGANQTGAPYVNPFGAGVLCQNGPGNVGHFSNGTLGSCPAGSSSNPAAGCPDGYQSLYAGNSSWMNGVTVWRNNNYRPVFDSANIYRISPLPTNMGQSLDVVNGSTAIGTAVEQYTSWDGVPQKFTLVADGSNWRIAMTTDLTRCIDLVGGGTTPGNGTRLQVNACSAGKTTQQFAITVDPPTGAFVFKNVAAGRCLEEPGSNTAAGVQLDIWDCTGGTNQKWSIQAYPTTT